MTKTPTAGTPEWHSLHHADQGTQQECTWDVCIEYGEWLTTDQPVCVACEAPILRQDGPPSGYRHIDVGIDHTAGWSPIQPGKWYREHTVQQLVAEHQRRGVPVPDEAAEDVEMLADSLNADDRSVED